MDEKSLPPRVLIFPLPLQGPINCMLKFAELLCLAGIDVTFLNTDHYHRRLLRFTDVQSRLSRYPGFRFETIPDGLPEDHPRSGDRFLELLRGLEAVTKPLFRDMLTAASRSSEQLSPVTCIIADGALNFCLDVAEEVGIPFFFVETISPCGLWTCLCIPKLIDAGEIPFNGSDLDVPIRSVPSMEGFLRRRDLLSFCRAVDPNDPIIKLAIREAQQIPRGQGLIVNTFEELDGPVLSHMRSVCPNLYSVGPLHEHLKTRLAGEPALPPASSSNSLWQEDRSCMTWLDKQPPKSVIYVSIGSMAMMTAAQLVEFWHGLVNSAQRFLWVRRPNSVAGGGFEGQIPAELVEATAARGCVVSWAPQEEVLAHPAVGGFLTHSGWNSTLESMVEGVPMLCWPYYADQQVNSRFVGEVWKLGMDMKDTCDRGLIESMIRELMEVRREELTESAEQMAKLARQSVRQGGSSFCDFNRFVEDIRSMKG
ncbi:7-deoxyloganetin glucosyltransferase [Bertholletia excelsa]